MGWLRSRLSPTLRRLLDLPGPTRRGVVMARLSVMSGYFDAASAVPLHPVARQALLAALDDGWADPDRLYHAGRRWARAREAAQAPTAEALGVRPDELPFTAGGTAAAHAAVLGGLAGRRRAG